MTRNRNIYYAQATVGGNPTGIYVEASTFNRAWSAAEKRIEKGHPRKEWIIHALQLVSGDAEPLL
jgi:hypothetical protein